MEFRSINAEFIASKALTAADKLGDMSKSDLGKAWSLDRRLSRMRCLRADAWRVGRAPSLGQGYGLGFGDDACSTTSA